MTKLKEEVKCEDRSVSTASSKVEEMMRAESRLSHFSKPDQEENENKAQYAWRLIRHCVKNAIELVNKADIKDMVISHGVHQNRRLNHVNPVNQILHNKKTKEYLTLDDKVIRLFMKDGRKKDIFTPAEPVSRLIFVAHMNLYVGWTPGTSRLVVFVRSQAKLMNHEFEVSSTSEAPGPIVSAVYNENIGEIVTIGPGHLTSWVFRYGGRHLLPRKTSTEDLDDYTVYSHLVLEETASRTQKAFGASGTSVAVFNLYEGRLLEVKRELHVRMITALLFFNPLKYLVTASKDGSIKVWDDKWHLQLVFVGHGDAIASLALFPYGPLIMSASLDCTIRVWSLETCDEVDIVSTTEPVLSLVTAINQEEFGSVSYSHADLWKIQHVHTLHTRVGYRVLNMKSTDHPGFPPRCVLLCKDSSVRILCPLNGDIITTLLVDSRRGLVDAAYTIESELMFAVFSNGDIVKCSTSTNPCKIISEWKCKDPQKACNYLLVYEYVISTEISSDTWGTMKRAISARGLGGTPRANSANRTLLLGGRRDGYICVFDMETGKIDFEIEAHGSKGVLTMIANSKSDQLISAGRDNIIKIWRLYPYAQESLAPLMSFYCAHTPVHMTVMKGKLAVAFQEHTTATYNVVMYNLDKKNRHDHGPEDDHMDTITGLASCNKMKIIASSSLDNTVRIWNENNILIRVIKLNARPHSITFCSSKGDLLVGIGDHVHIIDYKNYMPKNYRFKMVSMHFPQPVVEKALPFNSELLVGLSREDVKRLKAAQSSFNEPVHGWCQQSYIPYRFTHFVDMLTDDETDEVMREKIVREQAFNRIGERDKELAQLRDGQLTSKRKPKSTPQTRSEAFDKYLKFFYDRPKIQMPHHDLYPEDTLEQLVKGPPAPPKDVYKPEKEPTGFFPPAHTAHQPCESDEERPPIKPDCYVPNSVLLRLLWPQHELDEAKNPEKEYRPPGLTDEQLKQIAALNEKLKKSVRFLPPKQKRAEPKKAELEFRDSTIYLDYDSEPEEKKEKKVETAAVVMNKVQRMLARVPTPPPLAPEPEPVEAPPPPPPKPKMKEKMTQPFIRLPSKPPSRKEPSPTESPEHVEPPPQPKQELVQPPSPPPPKTPTPPPPPPTPLPDYISQFIGLEWFDKFFPDTGPDTFPKPWSMSKFVNMLVRVMKIAEYRYKTDIAYALITLHRDEALPHADHTQKALLLILGPKRKAPSCVVYDQKQFILVALELMHMLGVHNRDFYAELLVQFIESDMDVRRKVMEILKLCGLKDDNNYLTKELDTWDLWDMDEDERPHELRQMCREWLDKWLTSFKIHLEDAIDRLKKGQNIHGRVSKKPKTSQSKTILKKTDGDGSGEGEEDPTKGAGVQFIPRPPATGNAGKTLTDDKPSFTATYIMTFEHAPDASAIESATYSEAMNYFCEMQLEKELERLRGGTTKVEEATKNTVLVLPKLPGKAALVRLGETHTSKCRPHRETVHAADLRLPPITTRGHQPRPGQLFAFPTCVNLPMKPVYMNPFPDPADALELLSQQPVLLTLKSAQKYYVPSRSYVIPEFT